MMTEAARVFKARGICAVASFNSRRLPIPAGDNRPNLVRGLDGLFSLRALLVRQYDGGTA